MICVEGPELYDQVEGIETPGTSKEIIKNMDEFNKYMPHLKVIGCARPQDKYLLVSGFKTNKSTVAFTGSGSEDAPALK